MKNKANVQQIENYRNIGPLPHKKKKKKPEKIIIFFLKSLLHAFKFGTRRPSTAFPDMLELGIFKRMREMQLAWRTPRDHKMVFVTAQLEIILSSVPRSSLLKKGCVHNKINSF